MRQIADGISATGFVVNTYPANITYNMTDLSKHEWNTEYKVNGNVAYKETTVYLAVPPMDYIQTVDQTGGFSNKTFSIISFFGSQSFLLGFMCISLSRHMKMSKFATVSR